MPSDQDGHVRAGAQKEARLEDLSDRRQAMTDWTFQS